MQYKIEVERAVEYALRDQPEAAALYDAWIKFAEDQNIIDQTTARAIVLLGPVFRSRTLHPADYFRKVRTGGSARSVGTPTSQLPTDTLR